ncbi:hypothetical protein [Devosia ginsengisoli]|uniref:hypothetical protein n=1 Tax=Devosia ginsengisoli TaxID=400770 RepID=UPI001644FC96|nr:hypothetical protein [Devosia ginsengisoli]
MEGFIPPPFAAHDRRIVLIGDEGARAHENAIAAIAMDDIVLGAPGACLAGAPTDSAQGGSVVPIDDDDAGATDNPRTAIAAVTAGIEGVFGVAAPAAIAADGGSCAFVGDPRPVAQANARSAVATTSAQAVGVGNTAAITANAALGRSGIAGFTGIYLGSIPARTAAAGAAATNTADRMATHATHAAGPNHAVQNLDAIARDPVGTTAAAACSNIAAGIRTSLAIGTWCRPSGSTCCAWSAPAVGATIAAGSCSAAAAAAGAARIEVSIHGDAWFASLASIDTPGATQRRRVPGHGAAARAASGVSGSRRQDKTGRG